MRNLTPRLMVECNRMRYYACFLPSQRMEHLKTLIYVLTGVVPRNQVCAFEQKKSSALKTQSCQHARKRLTRALEFTFPV